jgi:hypothetical protein
MLQRITEELKDDEDEYDEEDESVKVIIWEKTTAYMNFSNSQARRDRKVNADQLTLVSMFSNYLYITELDVYHIFCLALE